MGVELTWKNQDPGLGPCTGGLPVRPLTCNSFLPSLSTGTPAGTSNYQGSDPYVNLSSKGTYPLSDYFTCVVFS